MPETKPHSPSLLKAVIVGIGIFALMYYFVTALNTRDSLWFLSTFKETPVEIIVHCYGTDIAVSAGTPAFEAVSKAVNTSMTGSKRWDETSMSDVTYQEYQTSEKTMVVELHYDPPATVHSQYAYFKNVNWLVFPLDGRFANTNAVFGRTGNFTNSGSYHVNSTAPIVAALQEQGICSKP